MTEINILGFVGHMIFCKPEYLLKRHFPKVFEPLLKRPQLGYLSWDGHSAWPEELDGLVRISLFSSVVQSCPTLWRPHGPCSMPGFPVHHQLPELAQTHFHRVSDAIQPSHPLSSPSPPTCHIPQHQSLFQWVNSLHKVAKVLEFQLQHQSFQWIFRTDFL